MSRFVPFCAREKSLIAKLAPSTAAASPSLDTATPVASESPELEAASCAGVRGLSTSPSASSAKAACAPPNASAQATARHAMNLLMRIFPSHAPTQPSGRRVVERHAPSHQKGGWAHRPSSRSVSRSSRDTHVTMPIG